MPPALTDETPVITGIGIVSPLGADLDRIWEALLAGKSGIGPIRGFDASGFMCRQAAQAQGLAPEALNLRPRDARILDTHGLMLMQAADAAFKSAALDQAGIRPPKRGFFAGMGMVDYQTDDLLAAVTCSLDAAGTIDYRAFYEGGYREIYPLWPLSMLNNISFCQTAIRLDLQGENAVFAPHADAGLQGVAEAAAAVAENRAEVALAGGVSEVVSPLSLARAHNFGILNTDPDPGTHPCRPFCADRRGTILGEGCAVMVLEQSACAGKRGLPALAAVSGFGAAFEKDARFNSPTPWAVGQAMAAALEAAGRSPDQVDLVMAHGDGTQAGDRNEAEAIETLFGKDADRLVVHSSKGALGHLLAAAPVVDTLVAIRIMETGQVPPLVTLLPESDFRFKLAGDKPGPIKAERILINAQSYEGGAAALLISKAG